MEELITYFLVRHFLETFRGGVELVAEHVHGIARRFNRHHITEIPGHHEMCPVVDGVVRRELHDSSRAVVEQIGNVVAHQ